MYYLYSKCRCHSLNTFGVMEEGGRRERGLLAPLPSSVAATEDVKTPGLPSFNLLLRILFAHLEILGFPMGGAY